MMRAALFSLLALGIGATSAARADTFDFSYTASDITAMGTFTATVQPSGQYLINSISGTRNKIPITALLAPGTVANPFASPASNDNILNFPTTPYLDTRGFAYTAGGNTYDVFYSSEFGVYAEDPNSTGDAEGVDFKVSLVPAPAPVAGGGLLSFLALGLAGLVWRGRLIMARRRGYRVHLGRPAAGCLSSFPDDL